MHIFENEPRPWMHTDVISLCPSLCIPYLQLICTFIVARAHDSGSNSNSAPLSLTHIHTRAHTETHTTNTNTYTQPRTQPHTDALPQVLHLLTKNLEDNGLVNCSVEHLNWQQDVPHTSRQYDLVLAADVMYLSRCAPQGSEAPGGVWVLAWTSWG